MIYNTWVFLEVCFGNDIPLWCYSIRTSSYQPLHHWSKLLVDFSLSNFVLLLLLVVPSVKLWRCPVILHLYTTTEDFKNNESICSQCAGWIKFKEFIKCTALTVQKLGPLGPLPQIWTWPNTFLLWDALLGVYCRHLQFLRLCESLCVQFCLHACYVGLRSGEWLYHWRISHFFALRSS